MPALTRADLATVFVPSSDGGEQIGIEVETAALEPATGHAVRYEGEHGLCALLARILANEGGEPHLERGNLVGVTLPSRASVSLENGGAVEYSSAPAASLHDAVQATSRALTYLAEAAGYFDIALVPGANYPFTSLDDVNWVPNARGELMRQHFVDFGRPSRHGLAVLALTLSTQATFDYTTAADLVEKFRAQAVVSTVAAALFVNSPLEAGRLCGALSRRMQYWSAIDTARTRINPITLAESFSVEGFIEWALTVPMIYRKRPDGSAEAVGRPFAQIMEEGFADGSEPDLRDWMAHLSQIYSDVRLRQTLEVRAVDGPPWQAFYAVPAFWTGLTYHRQARLAALEMLGGASLGDHLRALDDIAVRGLDATFAGQPVSALAGALVELSAGGLQARIGAGLEPPSVASYLDPLREIAESKVTFAQRTIHAWNGSLAGSPERYIKSFRI